MQKLQLIIVLLLLSLTIKAQTTFKSDPIIDLDIVNI